MTALLKKIMETHFARFFVVGTFGFLTDAAILQIGLSLFGLEPIIARVPSFAVAVLVTWYLNRGFTFKAQHKSFRESFPLYLSTNALGLAINFGVYTAGVMFVPALSHGALGPILALAIASIAAMFFNFAAAKFLVFRD